jgi:hypothetical protein
VISHQHHPGNCRLNSMLWERCLAMAFILRKPSSPCQTTKLNLSAPRGALQAYVGFGKQPSRIDPFTEGEHGWHPMPQRELGEPRAIIKEER